MRTVRASLLVGASAQLGTLVLVAAGVGFGPLGWVAGLGWALGTDLLLARALLRSGRPPGPADAVTLVRAALVGGVVALVAGTPDRPGRVAALAVLATTALVLDAVDGAVARRSRTASAVGARFDMEVDAFLILVLSVDVARTVGGWVQAWSGATQAPTWRCCAPTPRDSRRPRVGARPGSAASG